MASPRPRWRHALILHHAHRRRHRFGTLSVRVSGTLRATANSVCVAGGTFGAIIAPPLVAWLALSFNWHMAFLVPGLLGIVVAVLWITIYRDPPAEIAAQTGQTDAAGVPTPAFTWRQLWGTRTLWAILCIRFVSDPVWYFCLFWLPGYLQENSGLTLAQVGMVGWIPFLAADLGGIGTAAWSDSMVRGGMEPLHARKRMLTAVACLAPLCVLTPHLPHPAATLAIFSLVAVACLSWLFSLSVVIAEAFPLLSLNDLHGGDWTEWPDEFRVREVPRQWRAWPNLKHGGN